MAENLQIVLGSLVEVFGLIGIGLLYGRRFDPDVSELLRLTAGLFIPCLVLTSILDSNVQAGEVLGATLGTVIQIAVGLAVAALFLPLFGLRNQRELALPVSFVNSANLPLPLLLANFGPEAFARGILCFLTTTTLVFTVGMLILHGRTRATTALREPVLWVSLIAFALKVSPAEIPEPWLRLPRLAGSAAIPLMLVLFGISLSRTRLEHLRPALIATGLRYASGALALFLTLMIVQPEGMLRTVLVLYALLPSAVVTVVLTQKTGRNAEIVASTVLLTSLVSVVLLPVLLLWLQRG